MKKKIVVTLCLVTALLWSTLSISFASGSILYSDSFNSATGTSSGWVDFSIAGCLMQSDGLHKVGNGCAIVYDSHVPGSTCISADYILPPINQAADTSRDNMASLGFSNFELTDQGDIRMFFETGENITIGTAYRSGTQTGVATPSGSNNYKFCTDGAGNFYGYLNDNFIGSNTDAIALGTHYSIMFNSPDDVVANFEITDDVPYVAPLNTAPNVNPLSAYTLHEGDTYTDTGSFTDPDSASWTATADYGDGSGISSLPLNTDQTFSLSHQYQDVGTYSVTVIVSDNQGASGQVNATITVNDANPSISVPAASINPVQVNSSTTLTTAFTDAGDPDTHTAVWNWGDGSVISGTVIEPSGSTAGSVSDSHVYATAGVYTVSLTVTNDEGGTGTQIFQYLSVYNPTSQGLFSAGSRFTSPSGAYTQNSSLTGNVMFGLSYKYQGTMPVGDKQFSLKFNAANFTFNATTVSSLIIANGMGTLTGTGTINGSGTYNFLVKGNQNTNTIRIQITDASDNVIYDTQPGDGPTAPSNLSVTGHVLAH